MHICVIEALALTSSDFSFWDAIREFSYLQHRRIFSCVNFLPVVNLGFVMWGPSGDASLSSSFLSFLPIFYPSVPSCPSPLLSLLPFPSILPWSSSKNPDRGSGGVHESPHQRVRGRFLAATVFLVILEPRKCVYWHLYTAVLCGQSCCNWNECCCIWQVTSKFAIANIITRNVNIYSTKGVCKYDESRILIQLEDLYATLVGHWQSHSGISLIFLSQDNVSVVSLDGGMEGGRGIGMPLSNPPVISSFIMSDVLNFGC